MKSNIKSFALTIALAFSCHFTCPALNIHYETGNNIGYGFDGSGLTNLVTPPATDTTNFYGVLPGGLPVAVPWNAVAAAAAGGFYPSNTTLAFGYGNWLFYTNGTSLVISNSLQSNTPLKLDQFGNILVGNSFVAGNSQVTPSHIISDGLMEVGYALSGLNSGIWFLGAGLTEYNHGIYEPDTGDLDVISTNLNCLTITLTNGVAYLPASSYTAFTNGMPAGTHFFWNSNSASGPLNGAIYDVVIDGTSTTVTKIP